MINQFQNGVKAKWDAFQDQCSTEINPSLLHGIDDKIAIFSCTLLDIATDNILKTSPFPNRKPNLGLVKIVKQLERNKIKLINWLINILMLQIL